MINSYSPISKTTAIFMLSMGVWCLASTAQAAPLPCENNAVLPAFTATFRATNVSELNNAISNAQDGATILIEPGTYDLTTTLYIRHKNITLRGNGTNCTNVVLRGKGMDNASYGSVPSGIWTDAEGMSVMNLTIKDVYEHAIILNSGAQKPTIRSVQLLNTGQQFIKSNPTQYGVGVNNGVVANSRFAYETTPPSTDHGNGIGYTNGVDIHAGKDWKIQGNYFENFHTPDSSAWLWNPAILVWNGASGTISENNVFINVDRAIAYGLNELASPYDHQGGIIRNNMVYYSKGLYSSTRKSQSDGTIIIWNSPGTAVVNNTVLTNGNLNKTIEFRFNTAGGDASNNLGDAPIGARNSGTYTAAGNLMSAIESMFVSPSNGNLRLNASATSAIDKVNTNPNAPRDIDNSVRGSDGTVDIGAYEFNAISPPTPPTNMTVTQL